jgi:hypothetical protein
MNILVMQKSSPGAPRSTYARNAGNAEKTPTGRLREQIDARQGIFDFTVGQDAGIVEVCVQAMTASIRNPSRVALRVWNKDSIAYQQPRLGDVERLTRHSSTLEQQLRHIMFTLEEITLNADQMKDRQNDFQSTSLSLKKATNFWPAVRIFVISAAGFLQAHYVISYMKQRHIV